MKIHFSASRKKTFRGNPRTGYDIPTATQERYACDADRVDIYSICDGGMEGSEFRGCRRRTEANLPESQEHGVRELKSVVLMESYQR